MQLDLLTPDFAERLTDSIRATSSIMKADIPLIQNDSTLLNVDPDHRTSSSRDEMTMELQYILENVSSIFHPTQQSKRPSK